MGVKLEVIGSGEGTQSIDRALALLLHVGRAGPDGMRPADLVAISGLPKPTVRRVLLALVRSGLLDQDTESRRYHIGPEAYLLGLVAGARFGIHAMSMDGLARISHVTGDSAFLSVPRDSHSVCLHRDEGGFPIRTHVLQVGDRHPLGVGAGSLAILAALSDGEVSRICDANAPIFAEERYRAFPLDRLPHLVSETRERGYAFNTGMLVQGSWGVGVVVHSPDGRPAGALSIAAIEHRFDNGRVGELVSLLQEEVARLEQRLAQPAAASRGPAPQFSDISSR